MQQQLLAQYINNAHAANTRGDYSVAVGLCKQALKLAPNLPQALYNLGVALGGLGKRSDAMKAFEKTLAYTANSADAQNNIGLQLMGLGANAEAERCLKRALMLKPDYAIAYSNLGSLLGKRRRFEEAEAAFRSAIALQPDLAPLYTNLGAILNIQKNYEAAETTCRKAVELEATSAEAWSNLAGALLGQKRFEAAETASRKTIELDANSADAWIILSGALLGLKRFEAAEAASRKAIELDANSSDAWTHLAGALHRLKRFDAAETACRKAIELNANSPEAWVNLGSALHGLKRFEAAETACRKAIELDANSPEAWANLGSALQALKHFEAAEAVSRKAVDLDADSPEAWANLGFVLFGLKQYEAAADCFSECLKLNPDAEYIFGQALVTRMRICDWRTYSNDLSVLVQQTFQGKRTSTPFTVCGVSTDLAVLRTSAEIWVNYQCPEQSDLGPLPQRGGGDKIRIGYYSADFHNHATTHLMAGLFELHDKTKFELIGFSFGPDKNDAMRNRVASAFDQFIDVREMSGMAIAQRSREMVIDIAVDLKGYTEDCRTEIFSYRAAPIQVNYLGFPGTMGADYIDYVIADKTLIPVESQPYYSEKVVYLPNTYQVNDAKRKIADRIFTREEMGLPPTGFIFCCFNNNYKITPSTFKGWMRILKQVDNSVLWLFEENPAAAANLRKEASMHGIDPARLFFAKSMPLDQHLARLRVADLFIDTLPYNAHTTASDALWAGVPILTCIGDAFASRVAASLLNAINLPELITSTQAEFETLAIDLASHPERLEHIKRKLGQNRLTAPLFNTPLFTKHIEMAYLKMYERYSQGLLPDHIYVEQ